MNAIIQPISATLQEGDMVTCPNSECHFKDITADKWSQKIQGNLIGGKPLLYCPYCREHLSVKEPSSEAKK